MEQAKEGQIHTNNLKPLQIFLHQSQACFLPRPAIVTTLLGSCVAITMFDPHSCTGGICHALLPSCPNLSGCDGNCAEKFRFVDCCIKWMLDKFLSFGCAIDQLRLKCFGGSSLSAKGFTNKSINVGFQNLRAAQKTLDFFGLHPVAWDVGGLEGRKIIFYSHKGEVLVKKIQPQAK